MACKSRYTPQLQTFSPVEKMVWLGRLYPFVVGLFRPITSGANCLLLVFSPGAFQKQQHTRSVPVADCYHLGETPPPRKRSTWRSILTLFIRSKFELHLHDFASLWTFLKVTYPLKREDENFLCSNGPFSRRHVGLFWRLDQNYFIEQPTPRRESNKYKAPCQCAPSSSR